MRTQIRVVFISLHTERYETNGEAKRFDTLNLLDPETGQVYGCRVPTEAVGIADALASKAGLGEVVDVVLDVRAFNSGKRATMTYSLVDAELASSAAA